MGLMASTHVHMLTTDLVTWTLSKHTHNKSTNILAHAFFHSFSDEYAPSYTPTHLLEGDAHSITIHGYTVQNLTLFQQINLKALCLSIVSLCVSQSKGIVFLNIE